MANTYVMKIVAMDCYVDKDGLKDCIHNVHWSYSATDGINNANRIGVESLEAPSAEGFTPFDELSEADVVAWLEAKMDLDSLKANLDDQLDKIANPVTVTKRFNEKAYEPSIEEEAIVAEEEIISPLEEEVIE